MLLEKKEHKYEYPADEGNALESEGNPPGSLDSGNKFFFGKIPSGWA